MDSGLQPTLDSSRSRTGVVPGRTGTGTIARKIAAWLGDKVALGIIGALAYAGSFFLATKLDLVGVHKDQEAMALQVHEYQRTTEAALVALQLQIAELRSFLLVNHIVGVRP